MHHLRSLVHVFTQPSLTHALEAVLLLALAAVLLYVAVKIELVFVFALGVVLEVFSGNWKYIPFPLPLDRVVFLVGVVLLILRGTWSASRRRVLLRPVHFLMFGIACYVFANGLAAGTVTHSLGFYAWLDRLGVIPFLMFALAPVIFGTERQRSVLVAFMVALGIYLGFDALAEGLGVHALVLPHYISNTSLGVTTGRARGPFLDSDAMGIGLFFCVVFCALGVERWADRPHVRLVCMATIVLDFFGIFLTLTRAPWIGAVVGSVAAMAWHPRLRRKLPVVLAAGAVVLVVVIFTVPGMEAKVSGRVSTVRSVWDRYNTNDAAIRAVEAHPVFGIGWETFPTKGIDYLREAGTYPLTGEGLEVHNVFLSHFAELGIPAALCWILALFTAIGGAIVRRGPPELWSWRVGLLAMFIMFLVEANLVPLSYPFQNLIIWMMAGIVSIDRNSTLRTAESNPTQLSDELRPLELQAP